MTVIGHYYEVEVCPVCREQVTRDSDGDPDGCDAEHPESFSNPVQIRLFSTDTHVRLKVRDAQERRT